MMILAPTNRRIIRPYDKPSFEHTQRYGLIRGHWANTNRVGLWLFNEGSDDTVLDLSGNGLTGTFNGDIIWSPGKFGPCPEFPGDTNYITAATPPGLADITYVLWFKSDVGNAEEGGYLIRVEDTAISMDYGDIVWRPNVGTTAVDCPYTILAGVWYQIVVTQTGTSYAIYVNGILIQSGTTVALDLVSSFNVNIGNYNGAGGVGDWDGQIDVLSIYNRIFSASEIALLNGEPFLGIEKRAAPVYFFVPTGGVVYQELNLTVTADASAAEIDTHAMVDTEKAVQADAAATESDTQQMVETGKEVSADASVSCTDLKVVFELNLTVTAAGSVVATEAHTMMETGKSVTAVASPAVIDTQTMLETELDVSAEGSVSCTDSMGLLAHIAAFMILRQCTT